MTRATRGGRFLSASRWCSASSLYGWAEAHPKKHPKSLMVYCREGLCDLVRSEPKGLLQKADGFCWCL